MSFQKSYHFDINKHWRDIFATFIAIKNFIAILNASLAAARFCAILRYVVVSYIDTAP